MTLRTALCCLGGVGLMAVAVAQPPESKDPIKPANYAPPGSFIPPADSPPTSPIPVLLKVEVSLPPVNGAEAFPAMIAEARAAYAKVRDYSCVLVRREVVAGKLLAEQTAELRVRTQPASANLRVTGPKAYAGEEISYLPSRFAAKLRYKAPGFDGIKYGYLTVSADDPRLTASTRHTYSDTGLLAVIDRCEKALATEKKLNHPVQILVADYSFAGKAVTRYEVFAEKAHPSRYAYRWVVFVDKESKLPVRFEAYDQPKAGGATGGELLEMQSFVGTKLNGGLGDSAFER